MNYIDYFNLLCKYHFISPIWRHLLSLINDELKIDDKDNILSFFAVYFSLIDDGNICISLDKEITYKKFKLKYDGIIAQEDEVSDELVSILDISYSIIDKGIDGINNNELCVIGENKIFIIRDNYLYLKKYDVARCGIIDSVNRLFGSSFSGKSFCYKEYVSDKFDLKKAQEQATIDGVCKNLIITGGPGTGKTTSILFLLFNLLRNKSDYDIYLVAPSGKASSRMKESIINGLNNVRDDFKNNNPDLIKIIENLEESTIHRLLSLDYKTNTFSYNKYNRFSSNSIFIIDEASMIDVCMFNSLLEAIESGSRIFIMGDKNQLPSVDSGAVFGELLKSDKLKNNGNIIELDESNRFGSDTKIYELAEKINNGLELPLINWEDYKDFSIKETNKKLCPVYYYKNTSVGVKEEDILEYILDIWGKEYFSKLQDMSSDLDPDNLDYLKELFSYSEVSKILCAENKGIRGVSGINKYIVDHFIDKKKLTNINGYYTGEVVMINTNNKLLDLYNGDTGLLVTFKDDKNLYLMVQKSSILVEDEGKKIDKIFKLGSFVFYPLRMLSNDMFDFAYAITIHKSQGSDYPNILVILPSKKGHPLLNRQIIYTAITRTKGNTYILSNQDRLIESRDTVSIRDTNIVI